MTETCPDCGKTFATLDDLIDHGDEAHDLVLAWGEHGLADGVEITELSIGPLSIRRRVKRGGGR